MKHKKFICLALASVFSLSLVGFAACGDNDDKTETPSGGTEQPGGGTEAPGGGSGENPGGGTETPGGGTETPGETVTPDRTAASFSDAEATFTLDGRTNNAERNSISDSLFGIFLEDINYAGYLLADNLVFNGSFETFTGSSTTGWTASGASIEVKTGGGMLSEQTYYGKEGVNAKYANVTAQANGTISNGGHTFLPIAVEEGVDYVFSAFIKAQTGTVLTVRVKDASTTYCEEAVNVQGGNTWIKYEQTLTAAASGSKDVKLELSFADAGTYAVDAVSLETQNAKDGIKQYAYDAIADLSPKFMRFPGGCIIEGDGGNGGENTQEVYDWKNSIGAVQNGTNAGDDTVPLFEYTLVKDGADPATAKTYGEWATRRQNGDLWGYDMEYGVGFYEYFVLCDNIGASAVPVVNCGLSCQGGGATNPTKLNGRHGKKVEDYIQDAVDLIEFAKGDTSTKWGKIRELLGHPEPFEMDYIGIGNEQSGKEYYKDCYWQFLQSDLFQNALKQYDVKPIVGNGMFLTDCETYNEKGTQVARGTAQAAALEAVREGVVETVDDFGVVDQHYYVNYMTLFQNTEMYDNYVRPAIDPDNSYGVFVGEYSANAGNEGIGSQAGYLLHQNSLMTALSEAAMMTGFERNGDIIKLAAYAPMFGVANTAQNAATGGANNQWAVDMMYYTNTTIVRTANYYVQQLFMKNQGKFKLYGARLAYADGTSQTYTVPTDTAGGSPITIDRLYYVASKAENGDLILKIVNASPTALKLNIALTNAEAKGYAYVTEIYNAESNRNAINTLASEKVAPHGEVVGFTGGGFGQELKAFSVTALRFPVK